MNPAAAAPWGQNYDPLHNAPLSTIVAAIPILALLGSIAWFRLKAHIAAAIALVSALVIAVVVLGMPAPLALASAGLGIAFGLFPIGWIILNVIFLYQLTNERGSFDTLRRSVATISPDPRIQLLFIAFCLGAFIEGAAGFGTPVAVTGALLIALGFSPLQASGLSLIANTAPVAFGALGTPIIALQGVTGLDLMQLSGMVGRQLPFFSLIVPIWLIAAFAGFRGMIEVWPAVLVAGVSFAVPQWLISNYHGPWLVDIGAASISMLTLAGFLRVWQPRSTVKIAVSAGVLDRKTLTRGEALRAWLPWMILCALVFLWGLPQVKDILNGWSVIKMNVPSLHNLVARVPPVVATIQPEPAVFTLNWLSATGTAIFLAAVLSGFVLGLRPRELIRIYGKSLHLVRYSLLTIALMLALGYTTRYSGLDAILGLAFAHTGVLYPFFGTMLGWLGVALTGSDTSSNVLFGSLQRISAEQLGLNPTLMAAANSSGGVMGKMIDAQSIVVASTVTEWYGHEWEILRYVFFHSLALASMVGILVLLQAYVAPFTALVK